MMMSPRAACIALLLFAAPASADPLTGADFSLDYADLAAVTRAQGQRMTPSVLMDLSNPSVPNDVRAAIINALGWATQRQHHAQEYAAYLAQVRGLLPAGMRAEHLQPHELFALGYLAAMDAYTDLHPLGVPGELGQMSPGDILDRAVRALPNDPAVLLIRALVRAQELLIQNRDRNACRAYQEVAGVVGRFPTILRPNSMARILGNMETYRANCPVSTPRRRRGRR